MQLIVQPLVIQCFLGKFMKNIRYIALYIGDLRFNNRTIGDSLFWWNAKTKCFEMGADAEFAYSLDIVAHDSSFEVFEITHYNKPEDARELRKMTKKEVLQLGENRNFQ